MAPKGVPSLPRPEVVPTALLGLGVTIALVLLGELVVFPVTGLRSFDDTSFVVGTLATLPFLAGILYASTWLPESNLSPERYPRIAFWTVACAAGFFVLNFALVLSLPAESVLEAFSWLRWAITLGACVGLGIGIVEGRTIEHEIVAERARLRSEHVAEQRDTLDYLNSVLRHEVLNAATMIDGYVSRVLAEESDLDPEVEQWLEIALEETDDMTRVVDDVRVLLHRTTGDDTTEPTDLTAIVESEVASLTNAWPDVEVETSIPEDVEVLADDTLPRVFANLLSNAVEHNDVRSPRVRVDLERSADAARVEIADNGPGIPDDELDSLWERDTSGGDSHGLGLYLARELVESFGGAVELAETGPEGTTFAVELPSAPDAPDGSDAADDPDDPGDRGDRGDHDDPCDRDRRVEPVASA